jgi:hypothetical protein
MDVRYCRRGGAAVAAPHPGRGAPHRRDEFEAKKKAEREKLSQKQNVPKALASAGKDLTSPFLIALANREELVRNGKVCAG